MILSSHDVTLIWALYLLYIQYWNPDPVTSSSPSGRGTEHAGSPDPDSPSSLMVLHQVDSHAKSSAGVFSLYILRSLYWKLVPFIHTCRSIQPMISTRRNQAPGHFPFHFLWILHSPK